MYSFPSLESSNYENTQFLLLCCCTSQKPPMARSVIKVAVSALIALVRFLCNFFLFGEKKSMKDEVKQAQRAPEEPQDFYANKAPIETVAGVMKLVVSKQTETRLWFPTAENCHLEKTVIIPLRIDEVNIFVLFLWSSGKAPLAPWILTSVAQSMHPLYHHCLNAKIIYNKKTVTIIYWG